MTCGRKIGPYPCCSVVEGDCLELMKQLPDGCVDAVVTSPPYNLVKEHSRGGPNSKMKGLERRLERWYDDDMPEAEYQDWQRACIAEMCRVCDGSVFYNHKVRYALARRGEIYHPLDWIRDFPLYCEIIWDRCGGQGGNNGRYILSDERIFQINPPKVFNGALGYTNIWRIPPESVEGHVCAFPEELPTRCLLSNTSPGMVVLEPFAGSGTTLVAAKKLGRHFLGFEISEEYCRIARDRLARIDAQPTLFEPKPEQLSLGE